MKDIKIKQIPTSAAPTWSPLRLSESQSTCAKKGLAGENVSAGDANISVPKESRLVLGNEGGKCVSAHIIVSNLQYEQHLDKCRASRINNKISDPG